MIWQALASLTFLLTAVGCAVLVAYGFGPTARERALIEMGAVRRTGRGKSARARGECAGTRARPGGAPSVTTSHNVATEH